MMNFSLIKSKVSLQDIIESYGITVSNPNKFIKCCFHSGDNTPSLKLYNADRADGSFFCHGCSVGGDSITFVAKRENCSNIDALNIIAKKFGITIDDRVYTHSLLTYAKEKLAKKPNSASKLVEHLRVGNEARTIYSRLVKDGPLTPYMIKKKIKHYGTATMGDTLLIPVMDERDNMWGLQYIYSNGAKSYLTGCKTENCFFRIGPVPEKVAYVTEGYATGASVHEATGDTVFVCFTARNIRAVYAIVVAECPEIRAIVAGDNDASW